MRPHQDHPSNPTKRDMPLSRDQELWGMAFWVERTQGENGWLYIAQEQDRLLALGEFDGVKLWREVQSRFEQLFEMALHS